MYFLVNTRGVCIFPQVCNTSRLARSGPTKFECGGGLGPRVAAIRLVLSVASEALGGEGLFARAGLRWKLNI